MPVLNELSSGDTFRTKGLRAQLVDFLRDGRDISDNEVLAAMVRVPRHLFVDEVFIDQAYDDKAMPIAAEQTISQPYIVALQSQILALPKRAKVLEIGTGSGYQCAVLCEMGYRVFSIERQRALFNKTTRLLEKLGYNAKLFCGDGTKGLPTFAPFDGIIVTAGAPVVPGQLTDQLVTGGKLIIPVGTIHGQRMLRFTKQTDGSLLEEDFGACAFVPLIGEQGWPNV
jgi:protein-L-isoaspartate(D-aspartate) O-methyltransferase